MHECYRRQTTDGRAIAYNEREREFTFAKNYYWQCCSSLYVCQQAAFINRQSITHVVYLLQRGQRSSISFNEKKSLHVLNTVSSYIMPFTGWTGVILFDITDESLRTRLLALRVHFEVKSIREKTTQRNIGCLGGTVMHLARRRGSSGQTVRH